MAEDFTLTMIKPDAVRKGYSGAILSMMQEAGFKVKAMKYLQITLEQAQAFYRVHEGKGFYNGLTEFMSSGPIIAIILEKENAIEDFRNLIGATDSQKAEKGTIRSLYGESMQKNAVHGSDSKENAILEADFFFSQLERF